MKKKRIAQLCCAALVAAGIGLNIQNALTDYGMSKNSLSLVASPYQEFTDQFLDLTDETMGWCSFVNLNHLNYSTNEPEITNSNSNTTVISKFGRIDQCCTQTGIWKLFFAVFPDGHELYLTGMKKTYLHMSPTLYSSYISNPDGTQSLKYYWLRTCKEYIGGDDSDCTVKNSEEIEWID